MTKIYIEKINIYIYFLIMTHYVHVHILTDCFHVT